MNADTLPRLAVGEVFTATMQPVEQQQINRFGALLGTFGPIHTDPEWAKTTPLKGVVVQGGLLMAPVHDFMRQLFGEERWLRHGRMDVKIVSFTRPHDATSYRLRVEEANEQAVTLSISCTKEGDTAVMVGTVGIDLAAAGA